MTKRILLILIVAVSALTATAEFRWGPTVGLDVSNMYWRQPLTPSHQLAGFNAGVMGELMIPGIGFGIDMSLRYDRHGARVNFSDREVWASEDLGDENLWLNTVQVPINLRFKWTRMDGFEQYLAPIVFVGPVFNFNCNSTSLNGAVEHPVGTVAVQFGLGAEIFEKFQLTASYYFGASYEARTVKLDNYTARPRGWFVNAAWLF